MKLRSSILITENDLFQNNSGKLVMIQVTYAYQAGLSGREFSATEDCFEAEPEEIDIKSILLKDEEIKVSLNDEAIEKITQLILN